MVGRFLSRGRSSSVWLALLGLSILLPAHTSWAQTLLRPTALAYDTTGNLFFTDANRNQVFEVALSGAVTVVAGNGTQGFAGDGGLATSAELNTPLGIAVASDGTLFLSDSGNNRIRSIANGIIRTVAGNGQQGFSGDAGTATSAMLNRPTAIIMLPPGALLFCDTENHRVRSVANGVISTIAGNGLQGFTGDTQQAVDAELDSPQGIAAIPDGSLVVADTHNNRIRAISTAGLIRTIAGIGTAGSSGDGGPASAAQLSHPAGLAGDAAGNLYIAEPDTQRIRMIASNGTISTIAGSGIQGYSPDGTSASIGRMNLPGDVALSPFGLLAFTDTQSGLVRVIASSGNLLTVAPATATARISSVSLALPPVLMYGQGTATITVSGVSPAGTVSLLDGVNTISSTALIHGAANISLASLAAGTYELTASYSGDGVNPSAASPANSATIQPASIVATASGQTIDYGQPIPSLSGSTTGVFAQDAGRLTVNFQTTAIALSPVGAYPITASLAGAASANYSVTTSATSGTLQIAKAQSTAALQPSASQTYASLPLVLAANIASTTSGVPTGSVAFNDNGTAVASSIVLQGVASASYTPSNNGNHTITATYSGDSNFYGTSSSSAVVSVAAMPDFNVSAPSPDQSVQGGQIASFPLTLSAVGSAFTGAVSFSVKGLPAGASASFSPPMVVPGAGSVSLTMSVQTVALAKLDRNGNKAGDVLFALILPLSLLSFGSRKRKNTLRCLSLVAITALMFSMGCGTRTLSSSAIASQSSSLTVTASSTSLAGTPVSHDVSVSLIVH